MCRAISTAFHAASNRLPCFLQLFNYPDWRDHEAKALWEWLGRTGRVLEVIGMFGPLPDRRDAVEMNPVKGMDWENMSMAFVAL